MQERIFPLPAPDGEFRALIRQHGSMSARAMVVAVICLSVLVLTIGLSFFTLGFWLILPFAGLEIAVVAAAVAATIQRAGDHELIVVDDARVRITQQLGKRTVTHDFVRYWTQVKRERAASRLHPSRLLVGSHGRFVPVGCALTEEAREELARSICDALGRG